MSGSAVVLPLRAAAGVASQIANLLLANGQTTERTIAAVAKVGIASGLGVTLYPAWGGSSLLVEDAACTPAHIEIVGAAPTGVDMNKVGRTMDVVDRLHDGRLGIDDAPRELAAIARQPPVVLLRFATMAGVGAAALGVVFGATQPLTLGLIACTASLGAVLRRELAKRVPNPLIQPLAAALLAGLVGAGAARLDFGSPLDLIAVCPCMVLVPGPHLLNGILDLARTRVALGIARIAFATLIILMICVGLIVGLGLGGEALPITGAPAPVPFAYDVVAAGLAVAAYGSFFSMSWRTLPVPVAIGMLAHGCRWLALHAGTGVETGALIACLLVGTLVTPIANHRHWPFAAVAFASVVSLIPGVFLFRAAAGFVALWSAGRHASADLLVATFADATTAILILLAMAFGLIVPKMAIEHVFPAADVPKV